VFFLGPCDSSFYPYESEAARPWFDRPDARQHIESLARENKITADEATALTHFVDNGFLVLEDLIDDALIASINTDIDKVVSSGYQGYERGSSQRLEHLHLSYSNIRKLWLDPRYLRYVDLIFAADARPCQTLTYVFGSQQDAHQDTVHLTPYPAGYMCGTWIALQDVVPESGELVVYPGSHREKRVYLQGTGCEKIDGDWSDFGKKVVPIWQEMTSRYQPMVYRPRKGTVLIWHENLLHAGSARANMSLERRSIVIHSFAEGAIVYYDSTGKVGTAVRRQDMATA
jgi:ectoine hydroxylase-related dioxygenase (phytanoyl-CoA dioxygenase family)